MSTIQHTASISAIASTDLHAVVGGAGDPPSYNTDDLKNAASGAQAGARVGGPIGAVVGGGAGFMARNVGNLLGATRDYFNESQRGADLDAKLKALQNKK